MKLEIRRYYDYTINFDDGEERTYETSHEVYLDFGDNFEACFDAYAAITKSVNFKELEINLITKEDEANGSV